MAVKIDRRPRQFVPDVIKSSSGVSSVLFSTISAAENFVTAYESARVSLIYYMLFLPRFSVLASAMLVAHPGVPGNELHTICYQSMYPRVLDSY